MPVFCFDLKNNVKGESMAVKLIYKHQQKTYDLMRSSLGPGKLKYIK